MNANNQPATNTHLVKLSGVLNANREQQVVELFQNLAGQGIARIIIDMQDVPLIDSRGLVSLIAGYKIFGSEAKNFRLLGLSEQPKLVFELTGFDRIFEIHDNLSTVMGESQLVTELPPQPIPVFMPRFTPVALIM